jgi:hypothetical protein
MFVATLVRPNSSTYPGLNQTRIPVFIVDVRFWLIRSNIFRINLLAKFVIGGSDFRWQGFS